MAIFDYFLRIPEIPGESTDDKHKGEIDIESFSWGLSHSGSAAHGGGGLGAGKATFQDFHFTAPLSKASPLLFLACASGTHMKEAVLTARKAGDKQQDFYRVTLTECLVSSFEQGAGGAAPPEPELPPGPAQPSAAVSSGGDRPIDQFSLNFVQIKLEYRPQNPDGSLGGAISAGWDVKKGSKI